MTIAYYGKSKAHKAKSNRGITIKMNQNFQTQTYEHGYAV